MKTLDSVDERNVVRMLDRLSVLNICKEAISIGIQLKAVPGDTGRCSAILKQMIRTMRPDIECVVRSYATEKTRPYRMCIGKYQISMCPWYVQLSPIRIEGGSITISKAIRFVVPTILGSDCVMRIVRGPIGDYARARGFTLAYRTAANTDVIVFAVSNHSINSTNRGEEVIADQIKVMKGNMMSPLDFCRAVSLLYDELKSSYTLASEAEAAMRKDQDEMRDIYNKRPKTVLATTKDGETTEVPAGTPVAKETKSVEDEVINAFQSARESKRKAFEAFVRGVVAEDQGRIE